MDCGCRCVLLIIVALLLPPLAVGLLGGCSTHLWINILLCFLVWIPAQIHAIWYVATH